MVKLRDPGPILAELCILFAALWIDAFLPGSPGDPFSPAWLLGAAARNVSRAALVLLVMHKGLGFAHFGFVKRWMKPSPGDFAWAIVIAGTVGAVALAVGLAGGAFGFSNPLLANARRAPLDISFVFAAALSSLAVGYAEELFFRVFGQDSLERAGMGKIAAAAAISLVFGAAHGAQGIAGMASAALLGAVFSAFRLSGRGPHPLALGHALYDFAVLLIAAGAV
ncbi:MAG: CPBP family intramembrane glutamic endopeptidase [Rectinema sp.]